jgi:gas vesicle structural protein
MPVERAAGGTSLVDVLDRVLDKGIVIDAWVRVSLVGIDLITVEARVVVASIDTYLKYAEAVGQVSTASRPALEPASPELLATDAELLERERRPRAAAKTRTTPVPRRRRPSTT